jgi:hypothetical protein
MSDLLEYVSLQGVECLNEKKAGDWGKALKQGLRDQDGLLLGALRVQRDGSTAAQTRAVPI